MERTAGVFHNGQPHGRRLLVQASGNQVSFVDADSREVLRVAESLDLSLSAVYLPEEKNVLADMLSRAG